MSVDVSAQNDGTQSPYQIPPGSTTAPAQVQNQAVDAYAPKATTQVVTNNPYLLPGVQPVPSNTAPSDVQSPQSPINTQPAPTNHLTRRIPPVPPGTVPPTTNPYPAVPAAPANPYANLQNQSPQPETTNPAVVTNPTTTTNPVAPTNSTVPPATNPTVPPVVNPAPPTYTVGDTPETTRPFGQQASDAMHQFVKPPEPFQQYKPGEIMASVGPYVILARDIEPLVMQMLVRRARSITRAQLPTVKEEITREVVDLMVKQKLLYCDARSSLPEESIPHIEEQLQERFDEFELPRLLKAAKVSSEKELDEILKQMGSSIEHRRSTFLEQALAAQWIQEQMQNDSEITYSDMLSYYHNHRDEFDREAKTTWEQLTISHSKQPLKREGWAEIARMGNEVKLAGRSFAEVAKEKSHGPTASEGGIQTYPSESTISRELEKAITELPVGQLSPIIEDFRGFHIIRVVKRQPAGIAPFLEVQDEIKTKIRMARAKQREDAYLAKLRNNFHVWTIFDNETSSAAGGGTQIGTLPGQTTRQ